MKRSVVESCKLDTRTQFVELCIFTFMGHRCGYVGVPKNNSLWGRSYSQPDLYDIDVHGGLTFSGSFEEIGFDDYWFFGFDCAHAHDAKDLEALELYKNSLLDAQPFSFNQLSPVRTQHYVEKQCRYLLNQLYNLSETVDMEKWVSNFVKKN